MSIPLYDASIGTFKQLMGGLKTAMTKAKDHFTDKGEPKGGMENERLCDDMLPFSFQVRSAVNNSLAAIQALEKGLFEPVPFESDMTYTELLELVDNTLNELEKLSPEQVNALDGKSVLFKAGEFELPFTAQNFIVSFVLPNFYFHITTAYGLLRSRGVNIGKIDYLGNIKAG